jgi:predicted transcriptional regulator
VDQAPKKAPRPKKSGKRKPYKPTGGRRGRPKAGPETLPSIMDRAIWHKTAEPTLTNFQISEKLGVSENAVARALASPDAKKRLAMITHKVAERIADKHAELIDKAIEELPKCIAGETMKGKNLMVSFLACKFMLEAPFKKLAGDVGADEITFDITVAGDGAITNRVTKKKKGVEV